MREHTEISFLTSIFVFSKQIKREVKLNIFSYKYVHIIEKLS